MKFLICGLGSIGQRHLRNLFKIGERDVIAFRSTRKPVKWIEEKINISMYYRLEEAFSKKPDVAFITNPTSFHVPFALAVAMHNCHLFIEKPLSSDLNGVDELIKIVKKKKLTAMVGCNMRFHPGLIKIKKMLEKKELGDIYYSRVMYGSYLPDWHPWESLETFKKSYSADFSLGGGIILTLIHEMDYPYWFFGEVKDIKCKVNSKSFLGIEAEEVADIILQFKNGVIGSIHLDYLTRPPTRNCEIVGEKGKIVWDYYACLLRLYLNKTKEWQDLSKSLNWPEDNNYMYINELKHFISCIKKKTEPLIPLWQGKRVLEIALAAKVEARK